MKRSSSFGFSATLLVAAGMFATYVGSAQAAQITDGTAQWADGVGLSLTFAPDTALVSGDVVTVTLPAEASVSNGSLFYAPGDDPVGIVGHTTVNFVRDAVDNSVAVTVLEPVLAGQSVTLEMDDRVITTYNPAVFAQQSVAINTVSSLGAPKDFGIALITNDNTTNVTATVPLFVTMSVDDTTMDLGTLSVATVKEASQTYTINSNNFTGVHVSAVADGELRDGLGNTIDAVADGAVDAGTEEYGIALENLATSVAASTPYDAGDNALPLATTEIVSSGASVANGTFDLTYKAAIDGLTTAGQYTQTVTVTIATNV